jgi:hypothetical protein
MASIWIGKKGVNVVLAVEGEGTEHPEGMKLSRSLVTISKGSPGLGRVLQYITRVLTEAKVYKSAEISPNTCTDKELGRVSLLVPFIPQDHFIHPYLEKLKPNLGVEPLKKARTPPSHATKNRPC